MNRTLAPLSDRLMMRAAKRFVRPLKHRCARASRPARVRVPLAASSGAVHMMDMADRLDLITEWIRTETERPGARSREIVAKLLELAKLYEWRATASRRLDARLFAACEAMQSSLPSRWTVHRLAAVAGMSRAQFARRFTAAFGLSPREYLSRRRMERARELLDETDDSLCQIAVAVGYESEFAFNRAFRRHHGVPPGVFRRELRASAATSAVCLRVAA